MLHYFFLNFLFTKKKIIVPLPYRLLQGLNEIIQVKQLVKFQRPSKHLINVNCCLHFIFLSYLHY